MIVIPQRNDYNTETEYLDARWTSLLEEVGDVCAIHATDGVDPLEIINRARQRSQLINCNGVNDQEFISFDSKFEDETVMEDDNDSNINSQDAESDSKVDAEWSFLDTNFEDSADHCGVCDTNASFLCVDTDASTANDDEWSFLNAGFINKHDKGVMTQITTKNHLIPPPSATIVASSARSKAQTPAASSSTSCSTSTTAGIKRSNEASSRSGRKRRV
jgi:hypothetical protein